MRQRFEHRLATIAARIDPQPDARFLAFARAVVAFGGHPEAEKTAAIGFARWLETGGWRSEA